jgi:serine/threonine/tyrosine protein kinase RAD53
MNGQQDQEMVDAPPAAGDVATQETQQRNAPPEAADAHLWGYLQPCRAEVCRMDFWRIQPSYNIGRNTAMDLVLPGVKVSAYIPLSLCPRGHR